MAPRILIWRAPRARAARRRAVRTPSIIIMQSRRYRIVSTYRLLYPNHHPRGARGFRIPVHLTM
eukprot:SAG31_NODE_31342_length_369_cov_0.922222_1_plen_63_part_10